MSYWKTREEKATEDPEAKGRIIARIRAKAKFGAGTKAELIALAKVSDLPVKVLPTGFAMNIGNWQDVKPGRRSHE